MRTRYKQSIALLGSLHLLPFRALRERFREGYTLADLRADLVAGLIVAAVAIPLGMALAIATGVPPQHGLYTIVVAGFTVALLGGSRFQVTGPTAAFVVVLAPIVAKFGITGLLVAGFMAGLILSLLGMLRLGKLIQYIPHPVTTGFTAGIAVVIAFIQVKDFFGLRFDRAPETFFERLALIRDSAPGWSMPETGLALASLAALILWPRINRRIPAPLVVLPLAALGVIAWQEFFPGHEFATIANRFTYTIHGETGHGVPQMLPQIHWPWNYAEIFGEKFDLTFAHIQELLPAAFAIAILGAIESLLSAVVADGLAKTTHDPDAELLALGAGNVLCPFFGGIAATGAIARTATNIRFGATSPIAAMAHGLVTLLVLLAFAPYVGYLPMATLAALLVLVAWNISEAKHFLHIVRVAPRSDVLVLLICFALTVVFDMIVGVTAGVLLAAMLFMQRMVDLSSGRMISLESASAANRPDMPKDIVVYEIAGPLFFGAAKKAMSALALEPGSFRGVIFQMEGIPAMDITGLVAFESTVQKLIASHKQVALVGVQPQPAAVLDKAEFFAHFAKVRKFRTIEEATAALRAP